MDIVYFTSHLRKLFVELQVSRKIKSLETQSKVSFSEYDMLKYHLIEDRTPIEQAYCTVLERMGESGKTVLSLLMKFPEMGTPKKPESELRFEENSEYLGCQLTIYGLEKMVEKMVPIYYDINGVPSHLMNRVRKIGKSIFGKLLTLISHSPQTI